MSRTVELIWKGDNRSAIRALQGLSAESSKANRTIRRDADSNSAGFRRMGESAGRLRGTVAGLAGMVGLGGLAFGLKDVLSAGERFQAQQTQLQGALRATGAGVGNLERLTRAAEGLSARGGFGTAENLQGLTQFVSTTHSATKAQSDLRLATDISRRSGKDFTTVVRALMMLENGRTTGLARLGIAIPHITTAQQALHAEYKKVPPALLLAAKAQDALGSKQQAFASLQATYGGATARFANTTAGRVSNLRNTWRNLQEQLGAGLLPVMNRVLGVTANVVGWLNRHRAVLYAVLGATTAVVAVLGAHAAITEVVRAKTYALAAAQKVLGIGATTAATEEKGLTIATIAWGDAMKATIIGGIIFAVVELVTHFRQVKHVASEVFGAIAGGAKAVWHWIETAAKGIYHALTWAFGQAWKFIQRTPLGGMLAGGLKLLHGDIGGAAKSVLHGATFGLLHGGGVVRPKYLAGGGPVGSDTVPGWLTPGEGVVNLRGMRFLGAGGLAQLNAGMAPSGGGEIVIPISLKLDGRVIAQTVVKHALNRAARGPSNMTGGSLVTGTPGLPL